MFPVWILIFLVIMSPLVLAIYAIIFTKQGEGRRGRMFLAALAGIYAGSFFPNRADLGFLKPARGEIFVDGQPMLWHLKKLFTDGLLDMVTLVDTPFFAEDWYVPLAMRFTENPVIGVSVYFALLLGVLVAAHLIARPYFLPFLLGVFIMTLSMPLIASAALFLVIVLCLALFGFAFGGTAAALTGNR